MSTKGINKKEVLEYVIDNVEKLTRVMSSFTLMTVTGKSWYVNWNSELVLHYIDFDVK